MNAIFVLCDDLSEYFTIDESKLLSARNVMAAPNRRNELVPVGSCKNKDAGIAFLEIEV